MNAENARDGRSHPTRHVNSALEGLDETLQKTVHDFNLPGLALGVVAGGKIVYTKGMGYRDCEKKLPATADTLYAIGSSAKAMTSTLIGMLVDDGRLDFDEPVRAYLPAFCLSDPAIAERVTLRDMLTHRTGMPRHDLVWYGNTTDTREEIIRRLAHLPLTEDLRAKFQYNNLMYMVAGYIAGQGEEMSWEEAMQKRLFGPLGMHRSNCSLEKSQADADHALPYHENDDDVLERVPFRNAALTAPAGAVNSSVNEMCAWLIFNLKKGNVGNEQLISQATLVEIHTPQIAMGLAQDRPDISAPSYGMGWMIDTYRGFARIEHGGGIDGFATSVMFFPTEDIGLVCFDNRCAGVGSLINQHVADRLLGLKPEAWLEEAVENRKKGKAILVEAEKKKERSRIVGTSPSHELANYAGNYEHPGYGRLRIEINNGVLRAHFNDNEASLDHWHFDVWKVGESPGSSVFGDEQFLFRTNFDGLIAEVETRFELMAEPIIFKKVADERLTDPVYLAKFTGTYETASKQKGELTLSGSILRFAIRGHPVYTFQPSLNNRFLLKEAPEVSVGFEFDKRGKVVRISFYQRNGTFDALRLDEG